MSNSLVQAWYIAPYVYFRVVINIVGSKTKESRRLEKGERLFDMKKVGTGGIDYAKNSRRKSGLEVLREVLK